MMAGRRKDGVGRRALKAAAVAAALVALLLVIAGVGARAWVDAVKADARRAGLVLERTRRPQRMTPGPAALRWSAPVETRAPGAPVVDAPSQITLHETLTLLVPEPSPPGFDEHVRALSLAARDEDAVAPAPLRAWEASCNAEIDRALAFVLSEPDGAAITAALNEAYPPDGTWNPDIITSRASSRLQRVLLARAALRAEEGRRDQAEEACRAALRLVALRRVEFPRAWPDGGGAVLRRVRPRDPSGWIEMLDERLDKQHAIDELASNTIWPEPELPVRIGSGTLGFATAEAVYEDLPSPLQQVVQRVVLLPPIRARWAAETRTLLDFRDALASSAECLPDPLPASPSDQATSQWQWIVRASAQELLTREVLRISADPGLVEPIDSPCSDWGVTTTALEDGTTRVAITGSVVAFWPKQVTRERIVPGRGH